MKQFLVILLLSHCALTQEEFSFTLYFEDAVGNKDSLILGYDENGTQLLDEQFGEVDISDQPWDSVFEVRASNLLNYTDMEAWPSVNPPAFQSKKQIVVQPECPSGCYTHTPEPPSLSIGIKAKNFPITITWDYTIFEQDTCLYGTHISWEQFAMSKVPAFTLNSSLLFELSGFINYFSESYFIQESDTIGILWLQFCSEHFLSTQEIIQGDHSDKVMVYPNPASDQIQITISEENKTIRSVDIMDFNSNRIIKKDFTQNDLPKTIDITKLHAGVYFVRIHFQNYSITKKILKI
ncbi:MAG: T9SS type A sorting domain-containing protein [Crocinitomicaceae bacterium]|nr:T9SS type A sorting domain-containing protein [Crocinitomicaceae bacterium]